MLIYHICITGEGEDRTAPICAQVHVFLERLPNPLKEQKNVAVRESLHLQGK